MQPGIEAGDFGVWLTQARAALRGDTGSAVPCGDCTGCCSSAYSIEIRATDAVALERIPARALRRSTSANQWTVRPNPDGTCPMLDCGKCSIYAQRPQTCRDYDCRVFAAAGIDAGAGKDVINTRVQAWRFAYSSNEDERAHRAIQAAAQFIRTAHDQFPKGAAPRNPLGIAALALRVYPVFLPPGPPDDLGETARAILAASASFDGSRT
jgi:uncharacterized protein